MLFHEANERAIPHWGGDQSSINKGRDEDLTYYKEILRTMEDLKLPNWHRAVEVPIHAVRLAKFQLHAGRAFGEWWARESVERKPQIFVSTGLRRMEFSYSP